MYRTIIVGNDTKSVKELEKLLLECNPMVDIIGSGVDQVKVFNLIREVNPALVLIDISMPNSNAFKLLEKLMPCKFDIIFVSDNITSSIQAINFTPLGFLLKPIDLKDFQIIIQKAIDKISEKDINRQLEILMSSINFSQKMGSQKIAVPTLQGFLFLEMQEIIRFEANGAYTIIHTSDKQKIISSRHIKEYELTLPHTNFFRVHNSHIVNISRLLKYNKGRGGTIIMEDGTEIEVASRRRAEFLSIFQ